MKENVRLPEREGLMPSFFIITAGLVIAGISTLAFSRKSRKAIFDRDGGKNVLSGATDGLHASHYDHSKDNPLYDDLSNGRMLTVEEHLQDHIDRAGRNGLEKRYNDGAIRLLSWRAKKES